MPESAEQLRARLRAEIAAIERGSAAVTAHADAPGVDYGFDGGRVARPVGAPRATDEEGAASTDEVERAFRKIERLCLVREQASEQLRRRLAREGFEPEAAEEALSRALACGLVDDGRFADVLVRSRLAQGRGRQGIASELEGLGIAAGTVDALAALDSDDAGEVDRALALLDRKPPRAKNRRDAAYRRLAQKGFGSSVASTAARRWCEAHPEGE